MDGQQADGAAGAAGGPTAAEVAWLREFLGERTGANSHGSHKGTGERPDNVRPLAARRPRPAREVE